jgi:hypothetical protein
LPLPPLLLLPLLLLLLLPLPLPLPRRLLSHVLLLSLSRFMST